MIVLKEDEFKEFPKAKDKLPNAIELTTVNPLPNREQLWAWAHVHVNHDLSVTEDNPGGDTDIVNKNLSDALTANRDVACSRLLCSRKLGTNTGYRAFLIPTFETGRLAGLGLDLGTTAATKIAWEDANNQFPYYYSWYFRTGNVGDFEYLVDLIKPKPADKSIGVRDVDVTSPGAGLPGFQELDGVLKLGGALKVPPSEFTPEELAEVNKYDKWYEANGQSYPHPFQRAVAKRINLNDDYQEGKKPISQLNKDVDLPPFSGEGFDVYDPDPVVTLPLYGQWHSLVNRLLKEADQQKDVANKDNWVHNLNLDPRFRVAAGLGTQVIQKNQEEYMQAAWEQVGDLLKANQKLRELQMAEHTSYAWYAKHVLNLPPSKQLMLTAPIHNRVLSDGMTIAAHFQESKVPLAVLKGNFRSILRDRSRLVKLLFAGSNRKPLDIIGRINNGEIKVTQPKGAPEGAQKLSDVVNMAGPENLPGFIKKQIAKHPWLIYLPLILLALLLIIVLIFFRSSTGLAIAVAVGGALVYLYNRLKKWKADLLSANRLTYENQTPASVDSLPTSADFRLTLPGQPAANFTTGTSDNDELKRFKESLRDATTLLQTRQPEPELKKLDWSQLTSIVVQKINPKVTFPRRTSKLIELPERIKKAMVDNATQVWAYPEIRVPMYKPLSEMSADYFLPNINKVEQNSITILENNQKFIESYMVGLNHEMSRELMWREYPTDQRGSYFRQFWEMASQVATAENRDRLFDIPPLHNWSTSSKLGDHNHRASSGDKPQIVLVIRGELLKKYPTAIIYAQKAKWDTASLPNQNLRSLDEVAANATVAKAKQKIRTPLFEAKVDPDIYFFGFDLTADDIKGADQPTSNPQSAGWFFVIKEREGEPRFGLDDSNKQAPISDWSELSWKMVSVADGANVTLPDQAIELETTQAGLQGNEEEEELQGVWSSSTNSAKLAYVLYQLPVLVAVHGSRMLK
ncbi:MAG: hypothetical protein ACK5DD_00645 [Cyclobacteriaceae bacterium]